MHSLTQFIVPVVGVVIPFSVMLSGVLSIQAYSYLTKYEDPILTKAFVLFIWLAEYAQTIFCIRVVHTYISVGLKDILDISRIAWSVELYMGIEVRISSILHKPMPNAHPGSSYFLHTIMVCLSHLAREQQELENCCNSWGDLVNSRWVWIRYDVSQCQVTYDLNAPTLAIATLSYKHSTWNTFGEAQAINTVNTALALGVAVDLTMALFLIYEFRFSSRAPIPDLQTIVIYMFCTVASTLMMSAGALVTYNVMPVNLLFAGFAAIICKCRSSLPTFSVQKLTMYPLGTLAVCVNMMLANLNAHKRLRIVMSSAQVFDSDATYSGSGMTDFAGQKAQYPHPISILAQGESTAAYGCSSACEPIAAAQQICEGALGCTCNIAPPAVVEACIACHVDSAEDPTQKLVHVTRAISSYAELCGDLNLSQDDIDVSEEGQDALSCLPRPDFEVSWYILNSRNVATLAMIFWLFVTNVIYGVDSIIWSDNAIIVVPVWCDITTKMIIGANMALPAACMCVCIHLRQVASINSVKTSFEDKRRRQFVEAFLCFVLPIMWMAIHYIVQGHRFDIIEGYGCRPAVYTSIPSIFLICVPPLAFSAVTTIFAAMALIDFLRRRATFAKHLESRSSLSTSHYLRLMLMAIIEMVIGVASTSTTLWTATLDIRPWTGWADVHWDFSRIGQYLTLEMPPLEQRYFYALWWLVPISSYIFFLFFAFGKDAVREYKACLAWFRLHLFRLRVQETHKSLTSTIPSFGMKRKDIKSSASFQSCTSISTLPDDYPPSPPPKDKWFHEGHDEPDVPSSPHSAFSSFYESYSYQPSSLPSASTAVLTPTTVSVSLVV
ncbi:hypothetical protein NM688_g268 [Phlebia brevispora]|uniref:Uncharacterized protein n=1 Tax=Phlebia brevispora TaxID=194682 RepID=A0ACC1TEH4_9APHY|nr:hypothetical protein NM688_g268 [Phlebia brevispora]